MAMKPQSDPGGRPWAVGVTALVGAFILLMAVCVIIASRQDYQLVEADYYKRGLDYQQRIDNLNRANALATDLSITYAADAQTVELGYPPAPHHDGSDGTIVLYRPSEARWDRTYRVAPDSAGRQVIDISDLPPGLWRVKVDWSGGGDRYYAETALVIGG
jgi:nitrogen fixation protein FixH